MEFSRYRMDRLRHQRLLGRLATRARKEFVRLSHRSTAPPLHDQHLTTAAAEVKRSGHYSPRKPNMQKPNVIGAVPISIPHHVLVQAYVFQLARANSQAEDIMIAVAGKLTCAPYFFDWCNKALALGVVADKLVEWHSKGGGDVVETIISVLGNSVENEPAKQAEFVLVAEQIRRELRK